MGNMWRLAKKGSILNKRSQIQTLVKKKYKEQPLYRDANTKPKVFAMSLEHNETTNTYEPLLLRTYDHRPDETPITKGISNIKLWQAVSATCAIPGVYDQVKVKLDGASLSLVDGGLLANCPIESAIDEARRLFPNRRLGVVLSLGLDPTQTVYANRAIDVARLNNNGLKYLRIVPPTISQYSFHESSKKKLAKLESEVKQYCMNDMEVNDTLRQIIASLLRKN